MLAMDASKYEYQSEFARRYFGQGKAAGMMEGRAQGHVEGRVEGRVEGCIGVILRQLSARYGALSAAVEAHVRAASSTELDGIAERVLMANTLDEALGIHI